MWTLYDPLARKSEPKGRSIEPKFKKMISRRLLHAPSTLQKLWFLLEPTSPLSSKN